MYYQTLWERRLWRHRCQQFVNKIKIRDVLLISLLLCGCSRTYTGKTNVSSKPYFCRGRWYYPQKYYEYDKIGLASWYGAECHRKLKASGEIYNMFKLTAAHRTLPIPTVVRVTTLSLKNNKSIIVVIDDRGPYTYKNRIIDLSYGAAKALGITQYKPVKVRVKAIPSDSLKLSNYIREHCIKRKDPRGRTWSDLYFQEIRTKKNRR